MREVNGVFVDADREGALTELYQRLTVDHRSIVEHIEQGKRLVIHHLAAGGAAADGRPGA